MRLDSKDCLIYVLPAVMAFLIIFGIYRSHVPIHKITDPQNINLPASLKHRLLTEPDSELLYVDYHNRQLQYYFRSQNMLRVNIILDTMRKLIISLRYKFMEGQYLLVLHDGAHHASEWPVLAYATKEDLLQSKQVVLIPDPYATLGYKHVFRDMDRKISQYRWHKKIGKIFWRGSAFGVGPECNDLNGCARFRFMNLAAELPFTDIGFTSYTGQLNPHFKARLEQMHPLKPRVSPPDSMAYKYLIDIDGNSCSYSRMAWILYSNSVLMKHKSDILQWYYPQMQPYVHYIPIDADFGNLAAQYNWAETHPAQAQAIAVNGRNFARKIFSSASINRSMEQAFLQYQGLLVTFDHVGD